MSAFYDMGDVYYTGDKIKFYGPDNITPQNYNLTSFSDIRRSFGIAVQWLAPLGLFRFSYGIPLNARGRHVDDITTWGGRDRGLPVLGRQRVLRRRRTQRKQPSGARSTRY